MVELLLQVSERKASDLHLSSGAPPMMRIHGEMTRIAQEPLNRQEVHDMVYEILPDRVKARFEETLDVDFAMELKGAGRFRANLFMQKNGEAAVFRTIPTKILSFDELGLPDSVRGLAQKERGLVLVTGPTGSGKSTTLAAMIDLINSERKGHIITIEDPIEFVHPVKNCMINQREVETNTKSFSAALRAALREDPDVILVGELRDYETIELAVRAAETGHLVFGTLHTVSAAKTVDRMVDVFPADQQEQIRAMIAESLQGVVAQILLRTADGRGRRAALEIMLCNSAIKNYIRENKIYQIPSVIETQKQMGMISLEQSLQSLIQSGVVTRQEAASMARDLESLQILQDAGPATQPQRSAMPSLSGLNARR
jgi:twitching motility protein PilT